MSKKEEKKNINRRNTNNLKKNKKENSKIKISNLKNSFKKNIESKKDQIKNQIVSKKIKANTNILEEKILEDNKSNDKDLNQQNLENNNNNSNFDNEENVDSGKNINLLNSQQDNFNEQKLKDDILYYQKKFQELRYEVSKIVVGQKEVMDYLIEAILANGHCLVEGIPGIAKTLLLRTLAVAMGCEFKRIQFTPDLLPSDIVGVTAYDEKKGFYTVKGPVFANIVLGDEINRAPPKVQSALLEAMQEKQVTIGKNSFPLPNPFFVMATQNPIEQMGTYPLPEAQIDRFIYKIIMKYPPMEDEEKILKQNISLKRFEDYNIVPILKPEEIVKAQEDVKKIYSDPKIEKYIVRIVDATRNPHKYNLELGKYIEFGSSPRASISLYIASKAHALLNGKIYVTPQDIKEVALNIFRHRIILNYEGQAEDIKTEDIIKEILAKVPVV